MAVDSIPVVIKAAYLEGPADAIINGVRTALVKIDPVVRFIEQSLIKYLPKQYAALNNYIAVNKSPLIDEFPLMDPVQVLFFVVIYLSVVFIGKRLTQYTPRIEVKFFSLLHNFAMLTLSGYMCYGVATQALADKYSLFANPADRSASGLPMTKIIWVFYASKVAEFVDTFIMLLKKNYRQISFLHVYHHFSVFVIWWYVALLAPNGDAYFSAAMNSFIHVVMYGYYFLSAIGFKSVSLIKRYITVGQMTQFTLNFIQATYGIIDGYYLRPELIATDKIYPLQLHVILWFYMISMLMLFYNFFVQDRRRALAEKKSKPVAKKLN